MAIQVLLVNLLALSLGPLTVALLTDRLFKRLDSIGYALVWTVGSGALIAFAAVLACRRLFVASRVSLEELVPANTPSGAGAAAQPRLR